MAGGFMPPIRCGLIVKHRQRRRLCATRKAYGKVFGFDLMGLGFAQYAYYWIQSVALAVTCENRAHTHTVWLDTSVVGTWRGGGGANLPAMSMCIVQLWSRKPNANVIINKSWLLQSYGVWNVDGTRRGRCRLHDWIVRRLSNLNNGWYGVMKNGNTTPTANHKVEKKTYILRVNATHCRSLLTPSTPNVSHQKVSKYFGDAIDFFFH